jgi:hypothetical protein
MRRKKFIGIQYKRTKVQRDNKDIQKQKSHVSKIFVLYPMIPGVPLYVLKVDQRK